MANLARVRVALLGVFLFFLGLAVSGILRGGSTASNQSQYFDTSRGQMGFLLGAFEHRQVGLWLMMAGLGILFYAIVKQKWQ